MKNNEKNSLGKDQLVLHVLENKEKSKNKLENKEESKNKIFTVTIEELEKKTELSKQDIDDSLKKLEEEKYIEYFPEEISIHVKLLLNTLPQLVYQP